MLKQGRETYRIVMVDDEPDFLKIVRDWMVPRYELVTFTSGAGLRDQLASLDPDLLILDVRLPGADGFALCRQVRADYRFAALPILFLTASHSDVDFVRNIRAGGTAYLTKPIERKELLAKIDELLPQAPPPPAEG